MPRQPREENLNLASAIAAIVRAVQEGKRLGDLESARLAEEYRRVETLSAFAVPAFTVGDVDIELRFAVTKMVPSRKRGNNAPELQISFSATALKGVDPQHLQILKLRISPVALRVAPRERGQP